MDAPFAGRNAAAQAFRFLRCRHNSIVAKSYVGTTFQQLFAHVHTNMGNTSTRRVISPGGPTQCLYPLSRNRSNACLCQSVGGVQPKNAAASWHRTVRCALCNEIRVIASSFLRVSCVCVCVACTFIISIFSAKLLSLVLRLYLHKPAPAKLCVCVLHYALFLA